MARKATKRADDLLLLGLARGLSVQSAADHAGVNRSTAYRRLNEPAFAKRVADARGEMFTQAIGKLADSATKAVDTLKKLLDSDSDTIRLGAARAILEYGPKLREAGETEARIVELERRIDAYVVGNGRAGSHSRNGAR